MRLIERRHTLHLRQEDEREQWSFDARGRLLQGHRDDLHLRLGISGTLIERRGPRGRHLRRPIALPPDRALAHLTQLHRTLTDTPIDGPDELIQRILSWTPERYAAHATTYARAYRPVPILPPNCYQSVVVQVTEGCSHNECTFCQLYTDVPFRVKPRDELDEHLARVNALFGDGLALRTSVFLGDANALLIPVQRLLSAMERVHDALPGPSDGGFHSFVDAFTPPGRSIDELRALRDAGLVRAYVGLETGHAPLLATLGKPGTPQGAVELVHHLHDADLSAGVILLLGAGGARGAKAHLRDTAAVVRRMALREGDLLYLSPLIPSELSREALRAQESILREALMDQPCTIARYDLKRWVY